MARIHVTDKDEVRDLVCMSDGQDFLCDVIGGCNDKGQYDTARDDADFGMCEADFQWWAEWAYREERVIDRANELGEEAIEEVARLGSVYGADLDALHDAQERCLGL